MPVSIPRSRNVHVARGSSFPARHFAPHGRSPCSFHLTCHSAPSCASPTLRRTGGCGAVGRRFMSCSQPMFRLFPISIDPYGSVKKGLYAERAIEPSSSIAECDLELRTTSPAERSVIAGNGSLSLMTLHGEGDLDATWRGLLVATLLRAATGGSTTPCMSVEKKLRYYGSGP